MTDWHVVELVAFRTDQGRKINLRGLVARWTSITLEGGKQACKKEWESEESGYLHLPPH